ncbi:MAG: sulfatase [Chloroflexaceae bacterium]|nr:sulfatase [Chloroflexaceae bacterium]
MTVRPDIMLLVLDTQRADRLSCYNPQVATSPAIDWLAAESTLFRHAFSAAQWTIPSHASMFTGVYPSMHQTVQSFSRLPAMLPTLAERLRDGGYVTTAFCNNPLVGVVNNGLRRGFQSFLNYSGLLTSQPNQAGIGSGLYDRYRQFFKRLVVALLARIQDAFARSELLLALSFTPVMVPVWQTALSFKGNTARSLKDAARMLVERKGVAPDQPIFSYINLMQVHMPYHPPKPFVQRFAPDVLQDKQARRYLRRFNSDIYGWYAPLTTEISDSEKAILDGMYNAEVAYQDSEVGSFLRTLKAHGVLDNTLLMVCADHGDHLGEKQLVGHLFSSYNELVHVPLMVRDPSGSFPRGHTVDSFVSTRRIYHTALAAAGLADAQEQDLSLAQSATADPDRGTVFSEAFPANQVVNMLVRRQPELVRERLCDQTRRAVCSGKHKLIQTGEQHLELYSMVHDPTEQVNLRDMLPEQVDVLEQQLQSFVDESGQRGFSAEQTSDADDPQVRRRLRDLGYLE